MTTLLHRQAWQLRWYRPLLTVVVLLLLALGRANADPSGREQADGATWLVRQSALCEAAIQQAEARYQLPTGLLKSIARVESGRPITSLGDTRPWPWTIDADG